MMLEIIGRALGKPILAADELTGILMGVGASLFLAETEARGRHIAVDFADSFLKPLAKKLVRTVGVFVNLLALSIITCGAIVATARSVRVGEPSHILHIEIAPFRAIFGFGMLLFLAVVVAQYVASLKGEKK